MDSGSYKSVSSAGWEDEYKHLVSQVGGGFCLAEEKLSLCLDQQYQFKDVSNQLIGEVKGSIQSLNLNQAEQKAVVESHKIKWMHWLNRPENW